MGKRALGGGGRKKAGARAPRVNRRLAQQTRKILGKHYANRHGVARRGGRR